VNAPAGRNAPGESRPALGMGLMIAAMLLIPLVDGLAKLLSATHSPVLVSWLRYLAGAAVILPVALASRGGLQIPRHGLASQVLRTVFLVTAMTLFFIAISLVPLATALGAYFVAPIVATALAVPILGERLGPARVIAVVAGFAGVLLILRPGAALESGLLLALGSGFLFACYIIATRLTARSSPPLATITFQYVLGTILLTPLALAFWSTPAAGAAILVVVMGAVSVASHLLSVNAFRFADASTLSPLVYFELISATAVGYLFFSELPGALTWAGIALIVAGGVISRSARD